MSLFNKKELARLLGIKDLPPEVERSSLSFPIIEKLKSDPETQNRIMSIVCESVPDAKLHEVIKVFELFEAGAKYIEQKKGIKPFTDFTLVSREEENLSTTKSSMGLFCFQPDNKSQYVIGPRFLANTLRMLRLEPELGCGTLHKPTALFSGPQMLLVLGAEEAHHSITYHSNPSLYHDDMVKTHHLGREQYFVRKIETAYGNDLKELISDFNLPIRQARVSEHLAMNLGGMTEAEFSDLYRNRLSEKYGIEWPEEGPRQRK